MAGEIEHEAELSREEAATYFEEIAEGLRSEEAFTVVIGDVSVDVDPAETVEFEVELEDAEEDREFEIEMEWPRGEDELEIDAEE
ncbi:amphi-Trp domain-containing protein [Halalkalicoccus tibetensis]|uniref:Amphi-Trp domain-containing protein n=1 Tax=Halalkalicoccus tibetensis TaxID=175632 RepID=A0ABD5UZK9_9EURY